MKCIHPRSAAQIGGNSDSLASTGINGEATVKSSRDSRSLDSQSNFIRLP